jgi:4-azaleucine resistance transporter AzlC
MIDEPRPIESIDIPASAQLKTDHALASKRFSEGMRDSLPIILGYIAIGLAFGVVGRTTGLSVAEVALMSLILYAGSAQFVAAGLINAGVSASAIIVTIFLVNVRHVLYSAALAPHVRRLPIWQNALIGAELTDETFAIVSSHLARDHQAPASWLFGINVTAQFTWIASTTLGAVLGRAISNTQAVGLDFALPAMFAALLILQMTSRPQVRVAVMVALVSGVVAIAGTLIVSPSWAIIVAAVIGASVGVVMKGSTS